MMPNRDYRSSYPSYSAREEVNRRPKPKTYLTASDDDAYVQNSFNTQNRARLARKASFISTSSDDESDWESENYYDSRSGYNSRTDSNICSRNRLPPQIQDDSHLSILRSSTKAKDKKPREVPKEGGFNLYSAIQQLEAEKKEKETHAAWKAEMNWRKKRNAERINNLSTREYNQVMGRRSNDVRSTKNSPFNLR